MKATYETYNILLESSLKTLLDYGNEILIEQLNPEILRNICTLPFASQEQVFPPEINKFITKSLVIITKFCDIFDMSHGI